MKKPKIRTGAAVVDRGASVIRIVPNATQPGTGK